VLVEFSSIMHRFFANQPLIHSDKTKSQISSNCLLALSCLFCPVWLHQIFILVRVITRWNLVETLDFKCLNFFRKKNHSLAEFFDKISYSYNKTTQKFYVSEILSKNSTKLCFFFREKLRYMKSRISTKFHRLLFRFYFFIIFGIFFSLSPIHTCQKIMAFFVVFYSKE